MLYFLHPKSVLFVAMGTLLALPAYGMEQGLVSSVAVTKQIGGQPLWEQVCLLR